MHANLDGIFLFQKKGTARNFCASFSVS